MKFSLFSERASGALMIQFIVIVALFGGASRYDSLAQIPVRLSALPLIVWVMLGIPRRHACSRPVLIMLCCAAGICILQLVPLPPQIWSKLPGRDVFSAAIENAGVSQVWRPLNFTPDMGWNALFSLIPSGAILALWSVRGEHDVGVDAVLLVSISLASATLGVCQLLGGEDSPLRFYEVTSRDSAVGLFANRNHQALMLACSLPLLGLIGSACDLKSRRGKTLLMSIGGLGAFLLIMIFATGSRAGLLWAAIGLCGGAFLLRGQMWQLATQVTIRTRLTCFGLCVAFASLVLLATRSPMAVAIDRAARIDAASELRYQIWPTLWDMLRAYFPFGSGFGSFARLYRRFEPADALNMTYLNHAHNDLYELAIEGGAPAILLVLGFAGWWCRQCWRAFLGNDAKAQAGLFAGNMILAASVVDYPLRTPLFACFMTVACLWVADQKRGDRDWIAPS